MSEPTKYTEPKVLFATVREADDDEIHIECRFSNGEKYAAVKVAAPLDELADEIAAYLSVPPDQRERARAILGPPCPKCGHYLKAEHHRAWNPPAQDTRYYRLLDTCSPPHECEIFRRDLLTNHPDIAKQLDITGNE